MSIASCSRTCTPITPIYARCANSPRAQRFSRPRGARDGWPATAFETRRSSLPETSPRSASCESRRRRPSTTRDGDRSGSRATPIGYLAQGARSVYFAGDTDLFEQMEQLRGRVDVALLPIWGWGPTLGPGHLDPERAAQAAATIAPKIAIPIHWGTFALGLPVRPPEDPRRPVREFVAMVGAHAPAVEVRVHGAGRAPGALASGSTILDTKSAFTTPSPR